LKQTPRKTAVEILAEDIDKGTRAMELLESRDLLAKIRKRNIKIARAFLKSVNQSGVDSKSVLEEKFHHSIRLSGVDISREEANELLEIIYGRILKTLIANSSVLSEAVEIKAHDAYIQRINQTIAIIQKAGAKKKYDEIPGPYAKRVFVGGAYDDLPDLREIEEYVKARGFAPIVAFDYEIPIENSVPLMDVHDMDVLLVHNCRYAIFELTHPSGQYNEVEWAVRLFFKPTLGVCKTREQGASSNDLISTMVRDLFKKHKQPIQFYSSFRELKEIVEKFL